MNFPEYLEPVFLNDSMLYNSAAYLLEHLNQSEEVIEEISKKASVRAKLFIPFLGGNELGGEAGRDSMVQHKYTRLINSGALHMELVSKLKENGQLKILDADRIQSEISEGVGEPYVAVKARLVQSDFPSVLNAISIGMPLGAAIMAIVGGGESTQNPSGNQGGGRSNKSNAAKRSNADNDWFTRYRDPILEVAIELERDYFASGTLQLLLAHDGRPGEPFGVVDIDPDSQVPVHALASKLSGGDYWIIGKIVETADSDANISLIQRTVLSRVLPIFDRFASMQASEEGDEAEESPVDKIEKALDAVDQLIRIRVQGPAFRISALSVCI